MKNNYDYYREHNKNCTNFNICWCLIPEKSGYEVCPCVKCNFYKPKEVCCKWNYDKVGSWCIDCFDKDFCDLYKQTD